MRFATVLSDFGVGWMRFCPRFCVISDGGRMRFALVLSDFRWWANAIRPYVVFIVVVGCDAFMPQVLSDFDGGWMRFARGLE